MEEDDEEDVFFDPELFVNRSYKLQSYEIAGLTQSVYCSTAASTDHDLTGQVIWPVSVLLSWFIAKNPHLFKGKVVLELGAGCGLPGLVASKFARQTILTDGNEYVLELLDKNILEAQQQEPPRDLRACQLLWGDEESMKSCVQEEGAGNPDVLIGADIVCWPESILPLLLTLKALFHRSHTQSPPPALYLGFVCRATSTKDRLAREAKELGLVIENIPLDSFLPSERPPEVQSLIPLEIFKLFLDPGSQRAREPVCFSEAVMPKSLAC